MENNIGSVEKTLLSLLSDSIFGVKTDYPQDTDWSSVWKEAYMQAVPVLAFSHLKSDVLPEKLREEVRNISFAMLGKSMRLNSAHSKLHELLSATSIPYTILKGYASGRYYPDYMLRAMGDIDFLIHEKDIEEASRLLINEGFEMSHENHEYHRVFIKGSVRYEMHIEPSGVPDGEAGQIIREYLKDAIECSEKVSAEFGEVMVPSVFHHGMIILLHTAHHMTQSGVGLRHLCDWAVFVSKLPDDEFCDIFEEPLKKCGLWRFACVLTQTCCEYLGAPEKKWADKPEKALTNEIISDVFDGGNFGQKDEKRSQESLLISSGRTAKKRSVFVQLILSMNNIVYQKWKIAHTLKFLLPIGWLFFGGRYIVRMLMGKRPKLHPLEAGNEAVERIKIYDKLNLYDLENRR